jgi:hypothetical protein
MNSFFQKFREMESRDAQLPTAETPKITAVVTFEQILFYSVRPEDLQKYHELGRKMGDTYAQQKAAEKELAKQLALNTEYSAMAKSVEKIRAKIWSEYCRSGDDLRKIHENAKSKLTKLRKKLESEGRLKELRAEINRLECLSSNHNITRSSIVAVTPNISSDTLRTYGVLDYTTDKCYETWDEKRAGSCIRFLTDKMLDELSDVSNEEIEQIIFFSGLYARDHPYNAAMRVNETRGLERGKVQVYSTMSAQPPSYCDVEVLHKEREDLCNRIKQVLPETVVRLSIFSGPTVECLQDSCKTYCGRPTRRK